ncbi:MAG: hypothetical protein ACI9H6_000015 [Patiriisocius sp.]|jgi:hypothetical protein
MTPALIYLAGSVAILMILIGIFRVEDAREGKLVLLSKSRLFFSKVVSYVGRKLYSLDTYIGKGFARIMLHYAVHGLLERVLNVLKGTQGRVESLLHRNKQVVKEISKDKKRNHLDEIADHQQETALSEAQKKKMRSHE